jgi:hypothetical protein
LAVTGFQSWSRYAGQARAARFWQWLVIAQPLHSPARVLTVGEKLRDILNHLHGFDQVSRLLHQAGGGHILGRGFILASHSLIDHGQAGARHDIPGWR